MQGMGARDYHFITHWRVEADAVEVYDLLSRPENFYRWMKSFPLLRVEPMTPGGPKGTGRTERFTVKSFLPYTLCWEMECVEAEPPHRFTSIARGDLSGRGIWTFIQKRIWTEITFDWKITVQKPLLRYTSFFLRPIFQWNHDWIMERWQNDLQRILAASRLQQVKPS